MIETKEIIVVTILGYLALTVLLTYILRSRTSDQFLVGSRSVPAFVVGVLLMSEFIGSKTTVGLAQSAFTQGIGAGWALYSAGIGFFLLSFLFVKHLYNSSAYTISGMIEQRFGKGTKIAVSIVMIYALLIVNVGNFLTGAAALATALSISTNAALLTIAMVGTFCALFGGLKGLAYTNIMHALLKICGIGLVLWFALTLTKGIGPMRAVLPEFYFTLTGEVRVSTIVAWTIGNVGAIFSTQYIFQAVAANKDANAAQRSTFYAALMCLPIGLALGLVGVAARYLYPTMEPLNALPIFIQSMNAPLAALVTTSLVASVLVAVSTVSVAMTSLVLRDFYKPWANPSDRQEFVATRYISIIIGFAPLICIFFVPKILELSFFTRALRLPVAMIALVGVYAPFFATDRGAVAALLASVVSTSTWYFLGNPFGVDNMYVALLTPLLVLAAERLIYRRFFPDSSVSSQ